MRKVFLINRSSIISDILKKKGWKEFTENEKIDFSYFFSVYNIDVDATKTIIPYSIIDTFDNKKNMFEHLVKKNLSDITPPTYIDLKNIDISTFDDNKIFFLKKSKCNGGKYVYPINSYKELEKICNNNFHLYILQEEVPNMFLYNNKYKTIIRSYGLINNNNNYIFNNSKFSIYKNEYNRFDLSNAIHNDIWGSVNSITLKDTSFNDIVFESIKDISKKLYCFFEDYDLTDKFLLLGYDFILDKNFKPYLIEINAFPYIEPLHSDKELKEKMLNDLVEIVIFNNYTDKNEFIKLN